MDGGVYKSMSLYTHFLALTKYSYIDVVYQLEDTAADSDWPCVLLFCHPVFILHYTAAGGNVIQERNTIILKHKTHPTTF